MGTFFAGDLRTGRIRLRNLPAAAGEASAVVNGAGGISVTLQMPMIDPYTDTPVPILSTIGLGRSFLGYEEGGKVINAGPIWTDEYNMDAKTWKFNAAGLWSLWNYRFVMQLLQDSDPDSLPLAKDDVAYSGISLRTIAKRLVQAAQQATSGSVPLVFEPDFAGDNVRTYSSRDLGVLFQRLQELTNVINGPEISFRPQYQEDPNYIEWVMKTGNPLLFNTTRPTWDTTVPGTSIKGATIKRDGTLIRTDDYEQGDAPKAEGDDQNADTAAPSSDAPLTAKSVDTYLTRPGELVNLMTDPNGLNAGSGTWAVGVTGGTGTIAAASATGPDGATPHTVARATVATAGTVVGMASNRTQTPIPAPDGRSIGAGVWMKSSRAGTGYVVLSFQDASGAAVGSSTVSPTTPVPANTWVWLAVAATPGAGAVTMVLNPAITMAAAPGDTVMICQATAVTGASAPVGGITGVDVNTEDYEYAWNGPANASTSSRWRTGGWPRMEGKANRSGVSIRQTLQDYADGATQVGREPQETWSFGAKVDEYPAVTDYDEGDFCYVKTSDDPRLGSGRHVLRIMQYKITLGDGFAKLDCFPSREDGDEFVDGA